ARLSFTTAHNTPAALAAVPAGARERLVFHVPAGRLHLAPPPGEMGTIAGTLAAAGFVLRSSRGAPAEEGASVTRAGVQALRARVRTAVDPQGTFALGERWVSGRF
ncbi:MAG TPA: hypothetical protein VJY35_09135, partial [Candidatus Eisenbacteria bacterium]|nr:hypothetical protein [Candidatus Eisenbacteria bacterium]